MPVTPPVSMPPKLIRDLHAMKRRSSVYMVVNKVMWERGVSSDVTMPVSTVQKRTALETVMLLVSTTHVIKMRPVYKVVWMDSTARTVLYPARDIVLTPPVA